MYDEKHFIGLKQILLSLSQGSHHQIQPCWIEKQIEVTIQQNCIVFINDQNIPRN